MTAAIYLQAMGLSCSLGADEASVRARLFATTAPALPVSDGYTPGRALPLGRAAVEPPPLAADLPRGLVSRTNALVAQTLPALRAAVDSACARFGPSRVGMVLGSSTAGVLEGEAAARRHQADGGWPDGYHYGQQEMVSPAKFAAHVLGLAGPAYAISTACSSGAKALASGARLLRAGLVDAVVCGGADALCGLTVNGFSALESVSAKACNPLSRNREGINLGEGAALFVLSREPGRLRLAGWGETSDAHHMSAPDPTGRGAAEAMRLTLRRAGVAAAAVDYINLHGTATPHNDAMESKAVAELFGLEVPVSSTKPLTGHTLAAAGALEAAFAWLTLVDNPTHALPPHWWDGECDPALPALRVVAPGERAARSPRFALSNSFAFGGSNATLLFARD
ncbi:MAG TPA: beta-ketoacyl-ACP synthase [Ideonella sp.]|uniref:beta-ketoacyl-ACP synthase n=1 Tax=Ideonella sp. TaxID=1929293 RepID=UPI002E31DB60|nr:beta-ketoacyl-ACP synthase [Ideonella sp.]HEX5686918.1 beta-ketoacyl-ACP synthase [Ideonella sp.]